MAPLTPDLMARLGRPLRILAAGDELLRGEIIDSNSAWLAARLTAQGWTPEAMGQIGDRTGDLSAAVRRWREEGGCLVLGGGLGPTPDDLSREEIAAGLGLELAEHADAAAMLRAREVQLSRDFNGLTWRQALLPRGCEPIANPRGTAPAFWLPADEDSGFLLVLPGVPGEYRAIAEMLFPEPKQAIAENWLLVGLGEDRLARLLDDFPGKEDLGFYPSLEGHRLRLPKNSKVDPEALALKLEPYLVSRNARRLERVILADLEARAQTLAVAESCTGGMLGARITRAAGASTVFLGGVQSYSDRVKETMLGVDPDLIRAEGSVSEAVAKAMAEQVREKLGSDWALSITGIAGPGGERPGKPVGTLHFGLSGPSGTAHLHRMAGWDREDNRRYAVLQALTMLWQALRRERS